MKSACHAPLLKASRVLAIAALSMYVLGATVAVRGARQPGDVVVTNRAAEPSAESAPPTVMTKRERIELPNETAFFDDAAAVAWQQFDRMWNPRTGLASATPDYNRLTPWDIGSVLGATYSAHGLGLISDDAYHQRIRTTLGTLAKMPLYRGAVFHRMYFAANAKMVGRQGGATTTGYGWSATDLGRLLVWLSIIERSEPQLRDEVRRIVKRLDFAETTSDGYMVGGMIGTHGKLWTFQEGRIGYEQYAAEGFRYFGADVRNALDINKHAKPTQVLGVTVLADARGLDRLNSEPFVLMGMETGFTPGMERLAENVLAAQEARYRKTGHLTMVSEDAVSVPPYYFYYYCVLCNGNAFVVDVAETGQSRQEPRWVSTKASFGYHALMGTEYTRKVMEAIAEAKGAKGWSSGVFEKNGKSTNTIDINTAAVVLEAALYRKTGRPFLRSDT